MSSRGSTTAATPALSSPIRYEAQPRSSCVIWRKSISALRPLSLRDLLGQLRGPQPALDAREGRRRERPGQHARTQAERGDVDLGSALLDPAHDTRGDLIRLAGADPAGQPGPGVGEHPGLRDE